MRDNIELNGQTQNTPTNNDEDACRKLRLERCQRVEQDLANVHGDDEEVVLNQDGCPYEATNLMECPAFVDTDEDDDPETLECALCGRWGWRKTDSIGTKNQL